MESPLVSAALEKINPPKGYELLKARIVNEPDGSQTVRLLLDYGIGGVKVYEVEVADLSPLPPFPFREGGEKAAPVKKAGAGASRKAGLGGKK